MTPKCWDPFIGFFTKHGYRCLAPAWPFHDGVPAELRANPPAGLGGLGLDDIADHLAKIVRDLDEPPVLIGHSFGGLMVQLLLDQGLGIAGVGIDSAPPRGVFVSRPTTMRGLFPVVRTMRAWRKAIQPTFASFRYGFVHTLSPEEQRRTFDEQVVPESGWIFLQAAMARVDRKKAIAVDFRNERRPPLLLIAGADDHLIPAAVTRKNYQLQVGTGAPTALKEFPGRSHWIIAQPGWEEVAEACLKWIEGLPPVSAQHV